MIPTPTLFLKITLVAIILLGCDNQNTSSSDKEAESANTIDMIEARNIIQEKTSHFTEAHLTKDTAFLNNIFTKDAKVYPPNSDVVIGRSAIAQLNSDWVNYGIQEFKETSTSFYGNKDYLIDEGTYYVRFGDENAVDKGKYINIWKNENGEWKIFSNIWNTSVPISINE